MQFKFQTSVRGLGLYPPWILYIKSTIKLLIWVIVQYFNNYFSDFKVLFVPSYPPSTPNLVISNTFFQLAGIFKSIFLFLKYLL